MSRGRCAVEETDGRYAAREQSEDMCCQSADMLPELSGLSAATHQLSMEEEFDGDARAGEERRRGVKFVEDDRENDAAAFLKERTIEREECMREMEERERDIERAAEAAWRAEAEDDDGQDEDERAEAAERELGGGEEDEDEEGEEDEDEDGGRGREGEWDGAEEEDGQEASWPQNPLARTSTADRSFDDATQDPDSLEFVKSVPRRSQAYEPKNHPLAERLDEMEEAVFAVTSRTEKGQRIQLPEHLEKLQTGTGVPDSRPQSGSSEASSEDHGGQRDDDQCQIGRASCRERVSIAV